MGGKQRIYKQRIRSTQTLKKVFRAMELIAASRIGKAREAARGSSPYDTAITKAVAAVSMHSSMRHPLTTEREDTNRVAILCVTSDRGMAGAYSATILRATERLIADLEEQGKEPVLYTSGRRAQSYFRFRGRQIVKAWTGESDSPTPQLGHEIAQELMKAFLAPADEGGVAEIRVVFTRFVSMVSQVPEIRKMLPLKVVDSDEIEKLDFEQVEQRYSVSDVPPLYEFMPSADEVLNKLLPMYIGTRIRTALLQSAASELASRQQAMHTATDNAEDLINTYTRLANSARQAEITQEISEIVSGADALAASN